MEVKKKRERGRNFLDVEKETLLELIISRKSIIENKKTDGLSSQQKSNAWADITRKFNALAKTGPRNPHQLKLFYENLKKNTKKRLLEEKLPICGDGPKLLNLPNSVAENFVEILMGPVVTPLDNEYDSNETEQTDLKPTVVNDTIINTNKDFEQVFLDDTSSDGTTTNSKNDHDPLISEIPSKKLKVEKFYKRIRHKELFAMKKERHAKKMEILEIIKKKELEELRGKQLDNEIKEKQLLQIKVESNLDVVL